MARIGIGIDTGGTYTDAVAYDFDAKTILARAKALTTRRDLSVGILEAFDALLLDASASPRVVSLSTTLATNACVENRMGRAKLVFFGGDRKLIDTYGRDYGLPPAHDIVIQPCGATYSHGGLDDVDWEAFRRDAPALLGDLDGVGIIETYSMRNGAVIENRAKEILAEELAAPAVCGHELVSGLGCLQRGASTLLNASLFPTIHDFIASIKSAMEKRGVAAPLMIVRSDGNLMSEEFAALRPAETLLCGPAASVMGAVELTGEKDCVVVDMGGTTTDIAVVTSGEPVRAGNGIGVGSWKTFIQGLYISTFGLGGDSAVHYRDGGLVLEHHRVVPLCIAGAAHPEATRRLERELSTVVRHTRFVHEMLILARDIADNPRYDESEKRLCEALRNGPLVLREAAAAVGRDEYTFDPSRLVREGVVQVAGLTPTDIMHIKGDYAGYDAEASRLGARFVAENLGVPVKRLCDAVYWAVKKRLYLGVVKALLENDGRGSKKEPVPASVEALILDNFDRLRSGRRSLARFDIKTDHALVGIGAPIHIFLPDVAAMLGTRAVIPEHSAVANALGAVVGRIHAESEWVVRPEYGLEGIAGYSVFGSDTKQEFAEQDEAERFAEDRARSAARAEARRRGATGEIAVHCEAKAQRGRAANGMLYLGTRVVAHAIGSGSL